MRLVLVKWIDSFGCSSSWQELSEHCQPKPVLCQSVGWLFRETDDCKVIVPHVAGVGEGEPEQGCGDMTIPNDCIREMHDLALPA